MRLKWIIGVVGGALGLQAALALAAAPGPPQSAVPPVATVEDTAESGPTLNSIWESQELYFSYSGFTTFYTCDGLRDKLRYVLRELGARPDLEVRSSACLQMSGIERFPRVRIRVTLPVEATPERLAELERERATRELVARVNPERRDLDEATRQFPARTRRVEFRDRMNGDLQPGDCELMEQLADHLLPRLGVRVVERQIRCSPNQVTRGSIQLVVEVLEPVPVDTPPAAPADEPPAVD